MAEILIQVSYDSEDDGSGIGAVLDRIAEVIREAEDVEPGFGVQVDGEHRDPDDPTESLF